MYLDEMVFETEEATEREKARKGGSTNAATHLADGVGVDARSLSRGELLRELGHMGVPIERKRKKPL